MVTVSPSSRPSPEHIFNTLNAHHQTATLKTAIERDLFTAIEDRISPPTAAGFSLLMLAGTDAGDAYMLLEYDQMFKRAGFAKTSYQPIPDMPEQVLVSEKTN